MGKYFGGQAFASGVLGDGSAVTVNLAGAVFPLSAWVNPAAGDTVRVEYRCDALDAWTVWDNGDVTARSDLVFDGPISDLRFTRTAGTGTTSTYGVS